MANPYQKAIDAATSQAMQDSPGSKALEKGEASSTKTVRKWLGQPTDGQWTSETDKALQKKLLEYQERKGLPGTGSLDFETLKTMRQDSLDNPKKSDPSPDVVKALGDLQQLDIHRMNKAEAEGKPYEGRHSLQKPPVPEPEDPLVQEAPEQPVGSTMSPPEKEKKEGRSFSNSVDPGGGIKIGSDQYGNPTVQPSQAFMEAARGLPGGSADSPPSPAPQPAPTPQLDLPQGP